MMRFINTKVIIVEPLKNKNGPTSVLLSTEYSSAFNSPNRINHWVPNENWRLSISIGYSYCRTMSVDANAHMNSRRTIKKVLKSLRILTTIKIKILVTLLNLKNGMTLTHTRRLTSALFDAWLFSFPSSTLNSKSCSLKSIIWGVRGSSSRSIR